MWVDCYWCEKLKLPRFLVAYMPVDDLFKLLLDLGQIFGNSPNDRYHACALSHKAPLK